MRDKVCLGLASGLLATAILLAAVLFGTAAMVGDRKSSVLPETAADGPDPSIIHPVGATVVIEPENAIKADGD